MPGFPAIMLHTHSHIFQNLKSLTHLQSTCKLSIWKPTKYFSLAFFFSLKRRYFINWRPAHSNCAKMKERKWKWLSQSNKYSQLLLMTIWFQGTQTKITWPKKILKNNNYFLIGKKAIILKVLGKGTRRI